jgi:transcriptional regulator with XRE-family HTH domain
VTESWGHEVGKFYGLIQQHVDEQAYPPSERELARRLGVTPSTLANWRHPKKLAEKRHIEAVAELAGVSYTRALDALLEDIGYLPTRRTSASA